MLIRPSLLKLSAMLAMVAAAGAGCAAPAGNDAPTPTKIVLDLDGQVVAADPTQSQPPRVVVGTAQPGNGTDDLALRHVRQLSTHNVVGINEAKGQLARMDPAHPGAPDLIPNAFVIDWFPAAQGDNLWAVRIDAGGGCPTIEGGTVALPRYQLGQITQTGSVVSAYRKLPCGDVPMADSTHGIVVRQLTSNTDTGTPSGQVITNLAVLESSDHERVLVTDTLPIDSAADTALIGHRQCTLATTSCWREVDLGSGKAKDLPRLPEGRNPIGAGVLDRTGHYLALAGQGSGQGDVKVFVIDLAKNTVNDVVVYSKYTAVSPGNLARDMPLVWDGPRLYIFNPALSALTTYNAETQEHQTLTGLTSTGNAGVWGAA